MVKSLYGFLDAHFNAVSILIDVADILQLSFRWVQGLYISHQQLQQTKEELDREVRQSVAGPSELCSLFMFVDNRLQTKVVCTAEMPDNALLELLSKHYYLQKTRAGMWEAINFNTLSYIEIVEVWYPALFMPPI